MQTNETNKWERARRDAVLAALEAWRAIAPLYREGIAVHDKPDGPVTEADRLADRTILKFLRARWGDADCGYLTEESEDDASRLEKQRVWIIDPIDGTRDFIRRNGNFAVHIALVEPVDGMWRPVAAAVYLPVHRRMYSAARGAGATAQDVPEDFFARDFSPQNDAAMLAALGETRPLRVSERVATNELRSVLGNVNPTSRLMKLIQSLALESHEQVGSLGVKVSMIAEARAEIYVILAKGKAKEWDVCAPELILEEAGGRMSDLLGEPRAYNQKDARFWEGLLATNGPAHEALLERIADFLVEHPQPFH